nr:hypothetical protein [Pseudomonas aeruginosa]
MNEQHPLVGQPLLEAHQLGDEDMVVFDKTFLQRQGKGQSLRLGDDRFHTQKQWDGLLLTSAS